MARGRSRVACFSATLISEIEERLTVGSRGIYCIPELGSMVVGGFTEVVDSDYDWVRCSAFLGVSFSSCSLAVICSGRMCLIYKNTLSQCIRPETDVLMT